MDMTATPSMNNEYESKCFQWTMNMTANVLNEQWIRQQIYSRNSEYDSKNVRETIIMKAKAFNEQFNEHLIYVFNDNRIWQQRYSTNNEYDSIGIQWTVNMTAAVFNGENMTVNVFNEHLHKHNTKFMYPSIMTANVFHRQCIGEKMYSMINEYGKCNQLQ